jgi:hypothetical protein
VGHAPWVPRGPHRLQWLIRRFVDPDASFAFFGDPAEAQQGAELFDVVGAKLSHRGEDCSCETFLKEYDLLGAPVLWAR